MRIPSHRDFSLAALFSFAKRSGRFGASKSKLGLALPFFLPFVALAQESPWLDENTLDQLRDVLKKPAVTGLSAIDQFKVLVEMGAELRLTDSNTQPAHAHASSIITRLGRAGFLEDEVYLKNTLAMRWVPLVHGQTKNDKKHSDCVAVGRSRTSFSGSGVLVAPQLVLTAGHNADQWTYFVLIGASINGPNRRIFDVVSIIRPDPLGDGEQPDLALLILKEPVTGVIPRRIATTAEISVAQGATIVGFGHTDSGGTTGYGVRRFGGPVDFADPHNSQYEANPDTELVLVKHPLGLDACTGDSGGPLYIATTAGESVAAITSRAVGNAATACGDGSVYVRLDVFFNWITAQAKAYSVMPPVR